MAAKKDIGQPGDGSGVFGRTTEELRPIVERMAGQPVSSFDITAAPPDVPDEIIGVRGEKLILTITWHTHAGVKASGRAFVKKQCLPAIDNGVPLEARPIEASQYAHLNRLGAPVPEMYGHITVSDPEPREILFLEHLDVVKEDWPYDAFLGNAEHVLEMLSTMARFCALMPDTEYEAELQRLAARRMQWPFHPTWAEIMQGRGEQLVRVWQRACEGEFDSVPQRLCEASPDKLDKLRELTIALSHRIEAMPLGFGMPDFTPYHIGWRHGSREMRFFDMENAGMGARFRAVGPWIGAPDHLGLQCLPREDLARHFLDEYRRHGGDSVDLPDFIEEIEIVWAASSFNPVNWVAGLKTGAYPHEVFHRDLAVLLALV